jgi:hypothetical protein
MPTWGWWVVAYLVVMFWKANTMVTGYWPGRWWEKVLYSRLGEWTVFDVLPFITVYVAVRLVSSSINSLHRLREEGEEERRRSGTETQEKAE